MVFMWMKVEFCTLSEKQLSSAIAVTKESWQKMSSEPSIIIFVRKSLVQIKNK